jgi:hypothetical protein
MKKIDYIFRKLAANAFSCVIPEKLVPLTSTIVYPGHRPTLSAIEPSSTLDIKTPTPVSIPPLTHIPKPCEPSGCKSRVIVTVLVIIVLSLLVVFLCKKLFEDDVEVYGGETRPFE